METRELSITGKQSVSMISRGRSMFISRRNVKLERMTKNAWVGGRSKGKASP
jgi:hypothetical protein